MKLQIEVPGLRYQEMASKDAGKPSSTIRERVNQARKIQLQRFDKNKIHANAQIGAKEITRYCAVKEDADKLFRLERARLQPSLESWQDNRRSRGSRKY